MSDKDRNMPKPVNGMDVLVKKTESKTVGTAKKAANSVKKGLKKLEGKHLF